MANPNLTNGRIWSLHCGADEIAQLAVTGADMPWVHGEIQVRRGFEDFRPLFTEQEQAVAEEDWELADACYDRIRDALTMTFPDGTPVVEFMLRIHDDGTAVWRWQDEPSDAGAR